MEFSIDTNRKITKLDERGRITIPIEYRQFFPDETQVSWIFDGKKLIVNFENAPNIESLSMEYLYNEVMRLQKEVTNLREDLKQLRNMAFDVAIKAKKFGEP